METRSSSKYYAWVRPLHHWWKPLAWIWGALILGVIVNDGSSWLITKDFDISGTPLRWGIDHPLVTLPPLSLLGLLTLFAGLASFRENSGLVSPASFLMLTTHQRLHFIRGFQQEYAKQLEFSLQRKVALELYFRDRIDIVALPPALSFLIWRAEKLPPCQQEYLLYKSMIKRNVDC